MLPYNPPKVDYKRPRLKTTLSFLKSKGWTVERQTDRFIVVKPPAETHDAEEGNYRYYLPHSEDVLSYDEAAFRMVETFSEIFDIPLQELFNLLSKNLDEIKNHPARNVRMDKMQQALLANAG